MPIYISMKSLLRSILSSVIYHLSTKQKYIAVIPNKLLPLLQLIKTENYMHAQLLL